MPEAPFGGASSTSHCRNSVVIKKIVDLYFKLLAAIIGCILAVMVGLVFLNVVMRYAVNSGIVVSEEISRWLFVWLVFTGAIIATRYKLHISLDIFVSRLGSRGQFVMDIVSKALMTYVTYIILIGSWKQLLININFTAPASGLSMGYFYSVGVFFGVSTLIILVVDLVHTVWKGAPARADK